MKLYTTKEQTAHLIELGFPKPQLVDIEGMLFCTLSKYYATGKNEYGIDICYDNYSIGELISYLDIHLKAIFSEPVYGIPPITYIVRIMRKCGDETYQDMKGCGELIDKLYDACVTLKNEGVI